MPYDFVPVVLMKAMGWSWMELNETPEEVIDLVSMFLTEEEKVSQEKSKAKSQRIP